jgi:hypothetical protein
MKYELLAILGIAVVIGYHFVPAANAADGWLPDRSLTPGVIGSTSVSQICRRGYARSVRLGEYDPRWEKISRDVYEAYDVERDRRHVVDHLIPLEIGGSPDDERNVWPQDKAQSFEKDRVENALHAAVCYRRGFHGLHLTLQQAQRSVAQSWTTTPVGLP